MVFQAPEGRNDDIRMAEFACFRSKFPFTFNHCPAGKYGIASAQIAPLIVDTAGCGLDTVAVQKEKRMQGKKTKPTKTASSASLALLSAFAAMAVIWGCGTIAPEPVGMGPWTSVPDPREYAVDIEPLLVSGCAAAACHGTTTTFSISPPPAPPQLPDRLSSPTELPEPTRSNYFTVVAYSDPDMPSQSTLVRWACGEERAHPAGAVLTAEQCTMVIDWLEGQ